MKTLTDFRKTVETGVDLRACLAIMDTPITQTAAKSPVKITCISLKQTPAITNSHCYRLTDTFLSPDSTILLF